MPAIGAMQKASLPDTYGPFLGRATVEDFIADAERRAGGRELRLEVWKVNERAGSFYECLGFATTEEMADPDTGLAKLVMRRAVRSR